MEIIFYIVVGVIVLFFLGIIVLRLFEKPEERSKEFVLKNLYKIKNENEYDYEFDDFICVPIVNKRFEEMRKYCCDITGKGNYSNYSNDEKEVLNNFISELES
ncbi:MAG: hypothetical protein KDC90_14525, partial [Ignavibacteriae bacterium]|nr:hypothetical protein [Ignavibacteriota bacterium]